MSFGRHPPSTMPQPIIDDLAEMNPDALLADGLEAAA